MNIDGSTRRGFGERLTRDDAKISRVRVHAAKRQPLQLRFQDASLRLGDFSSSIASEEVGKLVKANFLTI